MRAMHRVVGVKLKHSSTFAFFGPRNYGHMYSAALNRPAADNKLYLADFNVQAALAI